MTATLIRKVHHVAYRCKDAKQTVEWYGKYLNMGFILAIALWLWFTVLFANFAEALAEGRSKAQAASLRDLKKSVWAKKYQGREGPEMARRLDEVKWDMINEWAVTRKAPQHARWMHDGSYKRWGAE